MYHLWHCLDQLRDDVVCNADDTPRAVTLDERGDGHVDSGQVRVCRDWDEMLRWASRFSGCWREPKDQHFASREPGAVVEFIYCPPDSPYYDAAQKWAREHGVQP